MKSVVSAETGPTEIYIARQPIVDKNRALVAYELLYRSSAKNGFDGTDSTTATSRVISNAYLSIGLERLVADRQTFINFDRALLTGGLIEALPAQGLVVELLEQVAPDAEVLDACRSLKKKGYQIALDDFVCTEGFGPLLNVADIVKVDFRLTTAEKRVALTRCLRQRNLTLLAEKIETREEFETAVRLGYTLFQGYYFSRPEIVEGRQIPAFKLNYLRILKEVGNPELDFTRVEEVLKYEASLIHKLLRYVNSAHFGWTRPVDSVRHALTLLGETEVRKWIALATLSGLASDKPQYLVVNAVVRGRFCESISQQVGLGSRAPELFLLGLYSLLDVLLDRPMREVVSEVHLADDVRGVLLRETGREDGLGQALALARACESGDWNSLDSAVRNLDLTASTVTEAYVQAVEWADQIFWS